MNPLTISLGIAVVVFFVLMLSSKSNKDFPFGEEPEEADKPTTHDWDNETTGY